MSKIKNGGLDQYGAEPFNMEQLALKGFRKQTSNLWVVKLSWLENAYSRPVLSTSDLDQQSRSG